MAASSSTKSATAHELRALWHGSVIALTRTLRKLLSGQRLWERVNEILEIPTART